MLHPRRMKVLDNARTGLPWTLLLLDAERLFKLTTPASNRGEP